ncbi:MAG TPA: large conductance mechanosensitive channel protein MscL [Candidatus Dormibacteraeota bacterium]
MDQVMVWIAGFRKFLLRGNVVDLAVAVVIGGAFGVVVQSFVKNILLQLIAIPGHTDFTFLSFTIGGGVFRYGVFIGDVITFVAVAAAVYFVVVVPMQALEARRTAPAAGPTTRACPECLSDIPMAAKRCAFCTAEVTPIA